jgi:PAS domain S-box-containing protein
MKDQDKSKAELLEDIAVLRQKITELEASDTGRKQPEKAFRESEGVHTAMMRSIGDHISMMDKDLNIIWANETATRLFGNGIVGKKCYEAYHQREEPCKPHPCLALRAFQDGKVHEHETQVRNKDGRVLYFHCTANMALRDSEGNPTAVIEISRDITDLKLAEEERDKLIRELQIALANVKTLKGLLPICSSCKKIRDDKGYWHQVEIYVRNNSDADFSHSICPDCAKKLYPEMFSDKP